MPRLSRARVPGLAAALAVLAPVPLQLSLQLGPQQRILGVPGLDHGPQPDDQAAAGRILLSAVRAVAVIDSRQKAGHSGTRLA